MLDSLRAAADTIVAKLLLGVLLLCFALLWGIPELNRTRSSNVLVSGGTSINRDMYRFILYDQLTRISLGSGLQRILTLDEAKRYGILSSIMQQTTQGLLLSEEARRMKIGVSTDGIAAAIGKDQLYYRDGKFDAGLFKSYLDQTRVNMADITGYYAEKEKNAQLIGAAVGGMKAPATFLNAQYIYDNEERSIDYIRISPDSVGPIAAPKSTELESWFTANQNRFIAPEYRQIVYLRMAGADLTSRIDISEEAIEDYYKNHQSRFTVAEKRTVDILHFKTLADAEQAESRLKAGGTFDSLVRDQKQTLENIRQQLVEKSAISLPIADQIFSLKKDEVSGVINDISGPAIARVVDIVPNHVKPLAEVKDEIKNVLTRTQLSEELRRDRQNIDNARNDGAKLEDLAKEYNLPVKTITLDHNGATPDGKVIMDLPAKDALLNAVFAAVVGVDHDAIALDDGGYVWFSLNKVIPSRNRKLSEVEEEASRQWRESELQQKLDQKVMDLKKELATGGRSLDAIAHDLNVQVESIKLKRTDIPKAVGANAVQAAFVTPLGSYGAAQGATKDLRLLFKVSAVNDPDVRLAQPSEEILQKNADTFRADIISGLLNAANDAHPVTVNEDLMKQMMNGAL